MSVQWALSNGSVASRANWVRHDSHRERDCKQKTRNHDDEEPSEGLHGENGIQYGNADRSQTDVKRKEMANVMLRIVANDWDVVGHAISVG